MKPSENPNANTLVAYYRYSGGSGQTEQSIEGQRRDCESFARAHGLTISHEYIDRHISGKTDNRAAFQQMMDDSDRHAFGMLICWKTDRLARNRYDSAIYKNRLRKNGVKILYAAESTVEGPEGIILEGLMESLAEYYSAELSQKLRRGQRESALKFHHLGGSCPIGLTVNKEHEYIIDEKTAPIVRYIFEQYAAGVSSADLVRDLNSRGLKTSRGGSFNKNSIRRIITNPQYIGTYASPAHGVYQENAFPALIDRDLWERAQAMFKRNSYGYSSSSTRADYILSGKLFCGYCGTAMKGISGTSHTGAKHFYYTCPGKSAGRDCEKKNIEKTYLESLVVQATADYVLAPGRIEEIAERMISVQMSDLNKPNPEKSMLENELSDVLQKQKNIMDAIENGAFSPKMSSRLSELESREGVLRYQLSTLIKPEQPEFTKDELVFMLEQFRRSPDEMDDHYCHRLVDTFISSIYITNDTVLIHFNLTNKNSTPESVLLDLLRQPSPENSDYSSSKSSRFDYAPSGGADVSKDEPFITVIFPSSLALLFHY